MDNCFDSIIVKNEEYLYYDRFLNALCVSTAEFANSDVIRFLYEDEDVTGFGALGIFEHGESLYFGNQYSSDVLRYDFRKGFFKRLYPKDLGRENSGIHHVFRYQKVLYRIPVDLTKAGYIFDMETESFHRYEALVAGKPQMASFSFRDGDDVYFTISGSNHVLKWSLNDGKKEWIDFKEGMCLLNVCLCKGQLVGLPYKGGDLFIKNGNDYRIITIRNTEDEQIFSRIFLYKDKLIVLPRHDSCLYTYDLETEDCKSYPVIPESQFGKEDASVCFGYECLESGILLFPWGGEGVKKLDISRESIQTIPLDYGKSFTLLRKRGIFTESEDFSLNCFLDGLCNSITEKYT